MLQLESRFLFFSHRTEKMFYCLNNEFQKESSKPTLQLKKLLHYSFTLLLKDRDACCPTLLLNWNKPEKQSVFQNSLKQKHPDEPQHVTYQSETFLCLCQSRIGSQSDTFIKVFHSLLNLVKQDFQLARMKENPISLFHLCFRHLHDNSISISYSHHLQLSCRTV